MYVRDYMVTDVITIPPDTLVVDAQRIMEEHKFHRLPVVDKGRLVGIVTKARLREVGPSAATTLDAWEMKSLLRKMKVSEVMEREVVTISPDTTISEAMIKVKELHVGSFPVLDGEMLVGIFTITDLLHVFAEILHVGGDDVQLRITPFDTESLCRVTEVISKHGADIHNLFTVTVPRTGVKELVICLKGSQADALVGELKEQGFRVERSR